MNIETIKQWLFPLACGVGMATTIATQAACSAANAEDRLNDNAPTCQPNDSVCVEQGAENSNSPVRDANARWKILQLGDLQCNGTRPNAVGNLGGHPMILNAGGVTPLTTICAGATVAFGMNYCNFSRSPSAALTDVWVFEDIEAATGFTTNAISVPALAPCECAPAHTELVHFSIDHWRVTSLMPGANGNQSFIPTNFSVFGPGNSSCN